MAANVDMRIDPIWKRLLSGGAGAIVIATVALFVISPLVAPGSLGAAPVLGMLPFAAVLAIAAAGQTLVVQQRGLDLSVPGMMALGAALVTVLPQSFGWPLWLAIIAALIIPGLVGVVTGLLVAVVGVMPLVVTLGMNVVLLGTVFALSNGTPAGASPALAGLASGRDLLGIPNAVIIAVIVLVFGEFVLKRTIMGRQLTAVGVSEPAAKAVGFRVKQVQVLSYAFAGLSYGMAAILYAGYVKTPPLFFGDSYLLPTVAAVVLGGTALTGGRASVLTSGIAALFLTQLGQLLRAFGWPEPIQLIVQALVLITVVLLRELVPTLSRAIRHRMSARPAAVT